MQTGIGAKPILTVGDPETVGMSSEQLERTRLYIERAVQEGVVPLADILIARHGKIVCRHSAMHPQLAERGLGLKPDSLFYLASFTKIFVATLFMQQVEWGNLSLDRPVADYIPEFGQRGKQAVTARQLLAHASGLPDELGFSVTHLGPISEFLEEIYKQPLVFEPGTKGSYSTWGYVVLAEMLRRVTGLQFEELARKCLFDPLGMSNSHFGYKEERKERVVPVFGANCQIPEALNSLDLFSMVRGDTGAYSTAFDIAALCQMMLNGGSYGERRILSPVTVQRMTERQYPWRDTPERLSGTAEAQFVTLSKGLGWMVRGDSFYRGSELMSPRACFHGGHAGMRTVFDPEYDLIAVYMTSLVATAPSVSAFFGRPAQVQRTFLTMAFAAISEL
jgi:CubicO group peptidase (beta-lactamase class C family)